VWHAVNTTGESNSPGQGAFKYELLLLLVSLIWGSAFVAQQIGMEKGLGPMTFNGLRFVLVCITTTCGRPLKPWSPTGCTRQVVRAGTRPDPVHVVRVQCCSQEPHCRSVNFPQLIPKHVRSWVCHFAATEFLPPTTGSPTGNQEALFCARAVKTARSNGAQ